MLLSGRVEEALATAVEAMTDLRTTTRCAAELRIVAAGAALAEGDRAAAERYLAAAVSTCRSTGMLCPFLLLPGEVLRALDTLGSGLPIGEDPPRRPTVSCPTHRRSEECTSTCGEPCPAAGR